jgi:hypothetical protein
MLKKMFKMAYSFWCDDDDDDDDDEMMMTSTTMSYIGREKLCVNLLTF